MFGTVRSDKSHFRSTAYPHGSSNGLVLRWKRGLKCKLRAADVGARLECSNPAAVSTPAGPKGKVCYKPGVAAVAGSFERISAST
jgi:hypothetical protein